MSPNAVRCMWNGLRIGPFKPRIPLHYRQIRWAGSFEAWSSRILEGSWEAWLGASHKPCKCLETRTLSTWPHSWPTGLLERHRTSRLDFVSFKSANRFLRKPVGWLSARPLSVSPVPVHRHSHYSQRVPCTSTDSHCI